MVSPDQFRRIGETLPGWQVEGEELVASWAFPDFAAALAAAVHVGALAEQADHHPDLSLGWGWLRIRLTTHSAGRLTEKDLELADLINGALGAP